MINFDFLIILPFLQYSTVETLQIGKKKSRYIKEGLTNKVSPKNFLKNSGTRFFLILIYLRYSYNILKEKFLAKKNHSFTFEIFPEPHYQKYQKFPGKNVSEILF